MAANAPISIANLSMLSENDKFLIQVSKKSKNLESFLKNDIPSKDKAWMPDLKSWEINKKWLLKVSDICRDEYDQVFFDFNEDLYDLNDAGNYQQFREKIIEDMM
ncbi:MAG: hypothetical protein K9H14_00170 [Actinomycetia bacterium]|nr:hypothetical protein [Actinomycetes bacterium]